MDYRRVLESLQGSGRTFAHDDPRSEAAIAGFRELFADLTQVGMSHIVFDADARVVLHQDFRDSAAGLFAHVPVFGWGIERIKRRL